LLLSDLVRGLAGYTDLLERVRRGEDRAVAASGGASTVAASGGASLVVSGGVGALPALLLAALSREVDRPLAIVVASEQDAERWIGDLGAAGMPRVFHAPAPTLTPYQRIPASLKARRDEFSLLTALSDSLSKTGGPLAAVLPARSLFTRLPDPSRFSELFVRIRRGDEVSLARLTERLTRLGYRRGDLVTETGDLAVRGGLFDVFPPDRDLAVRVELDGDRVESLRLFDPDTQRSKEKIEEIALAPFAASEESEETRRLLTERIGRPPSEAERSVFAPAVSSMPAGWLEHAADALRVLVEPAAVEEEIAAFAGRVASDRDPDRDVFLPEELVHGEEAIRERLSGIGLRFDRLGLDAGGDASAALRLPAEAIAGHGGRAAEAAADLQRAIASGEEVFVASRPTGGAEKLRRLAIEYGFHVSSERGGGAVVTVPAEISAGFRLREPRLSLYSEEEIFGEERRSAAARRKPSEAFLSDLRDLKLGDAVVHADYGIGLFRGLKRVPVEGEEREFMEIEYAEQKTLLLPVERFDLVQKYSGVEGVEPVLDRLGGAGWGRRKASVRKAMRDMTEQLLKLYARRSVADGFVFSKDSPWQKEFEDAFEYVETPDQMQAIVDVKRDMQSSKPMDRLLCGDVGYGKTEVAMRAAMKAVLDGKQVAVLAPTTILADQHFRTFKRRFAAFPVEIELLSRFRSRAEQKAVVARVAEGTVDILIATHRMLGKDLAFRDLGLLIVDEEQRFGVAQKERIKEWKTSIDVLAMSATPIPRSLHLSLSGLRDLSIIETPPRDRLAIETQVVPSRPEVIREAIEAELERGGQVFFVHNRIESIGRVKQSLEELLPGVRITVAHGQMPEADLEKAMLRFFSRDADVLLATAIVENGLDIPSANTILIDRADTFGLAQLYQLRGRVGRSDKPAYAYLLIDKTAALSEVARRRLASIQEFCDLGAGFRIAAKDLEIRGSGNILGGEQSGHIAAVGFETYLSLLEEAIREMRGEEPIPERAVTLSLGLDLAIPPDYVADESWRMMIYKKVARAGDDAALEETRREIADRFGEPPAAVDRLIEYARLRARAERLGVTSITRQAGRIHVRFGESAPVDAERLLEFVRQRPGASFSPARVLAFSAPEGEAILPALVELLPLFARAEAA
jgi:transcription-repair coupling factor (superfamily II helicase)